jgi:hypothetical protein
MSIVCLRPGCNKLAKKGHPCCSLQCRRHIKNCEICDGVAPDISHYCWRHQLNRPNANHCQMLGCNGNTEPNINNGILYGLSKYCYKQGGRAIFDREIQP